MPPHISITDVSHHPITDAWFHRSVCGCHGGMTPLPSGPRGDVHTPGVAQAARSFQHVWQRDAQSDGDDRKLENIGVGDRPHAAEHRVGRRDDRGQENGSGQIHSQQDAEGGADGDEQLRAPEQLAGQRGEKQDGRPPLAETRLERIDQRREPVAAHDAGEEEAAEDQADAEAEPALNPELDRVLVRAFGGAEKVAAVDPRRRHGERRDPQRHRAPGDDQVGGRALARLARGDPADDHEGAIHGHDGKDGWTHVET